MNQSWTPEEQLFLNHGAGRERSSSGRRFFTRGGVKYALLELLTAEPMHGYQMMKSLEEQSGGTYKPSAGSIYPTLQMLRDQGFVTSYKQEDGKKIFAITEEGKTFLREEASSMLLQQMDERSRTGRGFEEEREECRFDRGHDHQHAPQHEHEQEPEQERKRNRRLTPAGKELLHLLKAAEKSAMEDAAKAVKLRAILAELKQSLSDIAERGDAT
ncbi:PadR family transcriptional regulator [Paenibacillus soyae]|uniref:PadR family transcriptional regulator n=1 Tax=Paenibacillus soyae TaxID=2969249 RepID=A0A9X2MSM1_9BACL|nr:PadR family transcriptional regulator [Paenibacillus soyae]MCR2806064.1 PadR family transcriptional regulator [Paenibacillus soyae]